MADVKTFRLLLMKFERSAGIVLTRSHSSFRSSMSSRLPREGLALGQQAGSAGSLKLNNA